MNSTAAIFATTRWSVVLAAGQSSGAQASEALEQLCRTCYESPAKVFERNWALALMEQVLERLRAEQQVTGKQAQ